MMMLEQDLTTLRYALYEGNLPVYEKDENGDVVYYESEDGTRIPLDTGEFEIAYGKAVEFSGNIAMSGGEVQTVEYGIDVSSYDAILLMPIGAIPITETSLIWLESDVEYTDSHRTHANPDTADFKVVGTKPSKNFVRYILQRITK